MNWSRQAAAFDRIFNRQELTRAGSGSLIAAVSEGIVAGQGTGQRAREQIDSDFGLLRVVQQEWNDLDLIELEKVQNFLDGFVRDWVKAVVDKGLEEYWVAALGKFAESSIPKGIGFLIRLSRVICANLEEADFAFIKKVAEIFCKIMRIVNLKQVDNEILKNFFLPMQKWYRPDVNSLLSDLPQT